MTIQPTNQSIDFSHGGGSLHLPDHDGFAVKYISRLSANFFSVKVATPGCFFFVMRMGHVHVTETVALLLFIFG